MAGAGLGAGWAAGGRDAARGGGYSGDAEGAALEAIVSPTQSLQPSVKDGSGLGTFSVCLIPDIALQNEKYTKRGES